MQSTGSYRICYDGRYLVLKEMTSVPIPDSCQGRNIHQLEELLAQRDDRIQEQDARIAAQDQLIKEQEDKLLTQHDLIVEQDGILMMQDVTIDKLREHVENLDLKNQELSNELEAKDFEVEELQILQLLAKDEKDALPEQYDPEDNSWWIDHIAGWQQTAREARQEGEKKEEERALLWANHLAAMQEDDGDKRTWSSDEIDTEYVSMSIGSNGQVKGVSERIQLAHAETLKLLKSGSKDAETLKLIQRVRTLDNDEEEDEEVEDDEDAVQPPMNDWERRQKFSETYCGNN
jgi:hypothetical protein